MQLSRTSRTMLTVSLAVAIGIGCWFWFRSPSLESRLEQRRRSGLPVTSTELNGYYRTPSGVPDTTEIWLREIRTLREKPFWSRIPGFRNRLTGTIDTPKPEEQWPHLDACRGLVADLGQELDAIGQAAQARGRIRVPVDFSNGISFPVPILDELYQTGDFVLLDAVAAAHDNDGDRLFRDLQALLALSDIQREVPFSFFLYLGRIRAHRRACEAICRLVPRVTLSESSLEYLQSAVAAADFREEWQHALNGDCAIILSKVDAIFIGRLFSRPSKLTVLDFFDQTRDALSDPFPTALETQAAVEARYRTRGRSDVLWRPGQMRALGLLSDHLGLVPLVAREEARMNASVVALAALRYRHRNGHFPADMAELDDFLPDDAVATEQRTDQWSDPFNGEPLRYRADPHRVLIYSVSDNTIDDGGDFGQPDQPGIEPDIGVQLPTGLDGPASERAESMSE